MKRREMLGTLGALALSGYAATAAAQSGGHHHHGAHAGNAALIEAAGATVATGEACLAHCLTLLAQGDTKIAACAQSVNQMLATCGALQKLAAQDSAHLKRMARLAIDICNECERECNKHAEKHVECKACAEACVECSKQCRAITA